MSETISTSIYGISFFLSLVLVGLLWWTVSKFPDPRRFWRWIALGWTMNLVADLAWGVLYLVETEIWLDWIDYLYIGRYLVVFLAFLLFPKIWGRKQWLISAAAMLMGGLLVWLLISRPAANPDPAYALGGLIFPVMDMGLIYAACFRWRTANNQRKAIMFWMLLGMIAYGAANIINYSVRITNPEADSIPALLFWLLTTVFVGAAVWAQKNEIPN